MSIERTPPPDIDVLREHARGEHERASRLDCRACALRRRPPLRAAASRAEGKR